MVTLSLRKGWLGTKSTEALLLFNHTKTQKTIPYKGITCLYEFFSFFLLNLVFFVRLKHQHLLSSISISVACKKINPSL